MDFDKKEFYGIVAKAKKQMQITIDQDCNVADTKPDVEKMIQTRGIVKIQETEMMVDRVRIKGEFVFQGLYGTNDTSAYPDDRLTPSNSLTYVLESIDAITSIYTSLPNLAL